ncbi:MAG TPA: cation:proton antiporter [Longimicrobiaceae bacterium]
MLETVFTLTLVMLSLACLLTLWRVVRGPTLPDRVVALDLLGVTIVGIAVASSAMAGSRYFLDVAIVIALISFVGTVAYARYVEIAERA